MEENPLKANCFQCDKDFNAGFDFDNLTAVFLIIFIRIFLAALILVLQYCCYCYQLNRRTKKLLFMKTINRVFVKLNKVMNETFKKKRKKDIPVSIMYFHEMYFQAFHFLHTCANINKYF